MHQGVVRILAKAAMETGILATGCFNVAKASPTKALPAASTEMLSRLREAKPDVFEQALDMVAQSVAERPKIISLAKREDLHSIVDKALASLEAGRPSTETLLETGLVPKRLADLMLERAGDPDKGGSSLFEAYEGHKEVFLALCMEGFEGFLLNEGALRQLTIPVFEDLLRHVHRAQTQLDKIIHAVRAISEETGAPARALEAAYRAHVIKNRGEETGEEDLEDRLRSIAGDYELWKKLITGIDAREPKAAGLRVEALTALETGRFDEAQAKFKEAQIHLHGREEE